MLVFFLAGCSLFPRASTTDTPTLPASTLPATAKIPTPEAATPTPLPYQVTINGPFVRPGDTLATETEPPGDLPAARLARLEPPAQLDANMEQYASYPLLRPVSTPTGQAFNQKVLALITFLQQRFRGYIPVEMRLELERPIQQWIDYSVPSATEADSPLDEIPLSEAALERRHALLSLLFADTQDTGGAHPNTIYLPLNYDLTAGRPLELADLFLPGSPYYQVLSDYAITALAERRAELFEDYARLAVLDGSCSPLDETTFCAAWSLTPQGVLLTYQAYQVGPYAVGAQQVLVPWAALEAILDPAGPASAPP
jgi:hypothetical protein